MPVRERVLIWLILIACLGSLPLALTARSRLWVPREKEGATLFSFTKRDRVLVIRLSGMIADKETGAFSLGSTGSTGKKLRKALKDAHVKAVVLRINSPGGTIGASQELHDAVMALRRAGKPVVASLGDVAASGGYYVACAADKIVANPGTLTGSIGVIMNLLNLQSIEGKLGIKPLVIKSGPFKDMGSPNRPMTDEERKLLQGIISDSYNQFVGAVCDGRKMSPQSVSRLADGRVYTGRQAKSQGLVDELGGYGVALAAAQMMARERFGLTRDLPVDEGRGWEDLETILESAKVSFSTGLSPALLPPSLSGQFLKQPLWIWQ